MTKTRELGPLEKYLFRPVFVFVSFSLVLFALFQVGGRLAMATLSVFSDQIVVLAQSLDVRLLDAHLLDAHVEEIRGDWSGVNPVVAADRIVFAGGYATHAVVELDVMESIWRGAFVLRRLQADEVYLDFVQDKDGWRLRGVPAGQKPPDVWETLRHSDELQTKVVVSMSNAGGVRSELSGQIRIANHGKLHYLRLNLGSHDNHVMQLQGWQEARQFGFEASEPRSVLVANGKLALPQALVPAAITVDFKKGRWSGVGASGFGQLALAAQVVLPDVGHELEVQIGSNWVAAQGGLTGVMDTLQLSSQGQMVDLSPLHLFAEVDVAEVDVAEVDVAEVDVAEVDVAEVDAERQGTMVRVWQQEFDLNAISTFLTQYFGSNHLVGTWAGATAIKGSAHNVSAFYDTDVGWGYGATLVDLSMNGYRGAPSFENAQGRLRGHLSGASLQINAQDLQLNFPDLFTDTWPLDYFQGTVKAYFNSGYFGLRGEHLKTKIKGSSMVGTFSLTRPEERFERRVALGLRIDQATMANVRSFVPYKIPVGFARWLDYGLISGRLDDSTFVYQGQVHKQVEDGLHRRIELTTQISDAEIRYARSWPIVSHLDSRVHSAGREFRAHFQKGRTQSLDLGVGEIVLRENAAFAEIQITAEGDGQAMLDFVLTSPLQKNMGFVTRAWRSHGAMHLDGSLTIPIRPDGTPELKVDLAFTVADLMLDMPEYRSHFDGLSGQGTFALPHLLDGKFSGNLFDQPAEISARSDSDWIFFDINGRVTPEHVYRVAGLSELDVMQGDFGFVSTLGVAMTEQMITNLELTSDLQGLRVSLPGQLGKGVDEHVPLELDVHFLPEYQSIGWRYKETQGWLHHTDQIDRGAIGLNENPPMTDDNQQAILIRGSLDQVVLSDWVSGEGEVAVALPQDWIIQHLAINEFSIDDLTFPSLVLTGNQTNQNVEFNLAGADLTGTIRISDTGLVDVNLEHLRLPESAVTAAPYEDVLLVKTATDPIPIDVGKNLPAARVSIGRLELGSKPFGQWRFVIEPQEHGVQFSEFGADVNGIHIDQADVYWDLVANQSHFQGDITLDDLRETLPLWDYAAALQTSTATLTADTAWSGSPANVSLLGLNGELGFRAKDGRFLDVQSGGGLRVLSLLNFSNIAKRISFDFSDVTKEGMEFDEIRARVDLKNGHLRFIDRMEVESKSSNFQIGGNVNLHSGVLDNEMIVTLPVSDSLPWYGVYLALANPLAGLGVLVGERVLRKPLRAFSTAKFEVKGTLDVPEVNFVSLWDQSMRETEKKDVQIGGSR